MLYLHIPFQPPTPSKRTMAGSAGGSGYYPTSPTTCPSAAAAGGGGGGFAPRRDLLGKDQPLYARVDKHNNCNVIVNPSNGSRNNGGGSPDKSWMPLLVSRNQQESTL